jgi:hypothetical protein
MEGTTLKEASCSIANPAIAKNPTAFQFYGWNRGNRNSKGMQQLA